MTLPWKPFAMRLCGKTWTVGWEEGLSVTRDTRGECRPRTAQIVLDAGITVDNAQEVLLHELIEAIDKEFGLGIQHSSVEVLGMVLHQALVDNLKLCRAITTIKAKKGTKK